MTRYVLFGSRTESLDRVRSVIEGSIAVTLEPRESDHRGGGYFRSPLGSSEELILQANFEDEDGEVAEPAFPSYPTLLYLNHPAPLMESLLAGVGGLDLLRIEEV